MQIEARSSYKQLLLPCPGSHQDCASQIPKRAHNTAGKRRFVPDPDWNNRGKLAAGAAAGTTSNLQEKPSRDTKTDLFLCLLQHICLGWDSRPFPYWQMSASSVCFWRLLHLCPTHAHSRGSCFTSCSDCSTFIMQINFKYTQGKKSKLGMDKDYKTWEFVRGYNKAQC